uniref:Heterokaryon incompatibility domain-containing protein n=1 Tax=Pyricularia oryzae (strain P131) TaxID=1143193 RepID=L7JI13_PYRO1
MPRSNIEIGLQRGARASLLLCAASSLTTRLLGPSWKTLAATTVATLSVGFALSRPQCRTVDSIAAAHALFVFLVTSVVLSRWDALTTLFAIFTATHVLLSIGEYFQGNQVLSRWNQGLFRYIGGFITFFGTKLKSAKQVRQWWLRTPAVILAGVPFFMAISALATWNMMQELPYADWPWFRGVVREQRLRARSWTSWRYRAPAYVHSPITKGFQGRIRLLKLRPRWPLGEIRCELVEADMGTTSCPDYEAISYHWGPGKPTEPIYIDGKVFHVSPTVLAALYQLSSYHQTRHLWIDSICINQRDTDEKGSQITLMRDIYRHARGVTVWLDGIPEPWEARKMLAGLWHEIKFGTTQSVTAMLRMYSEQWRDSGWDQLCAVFCHPWFFRIWVIQEVSSAVDPEAVTILTSTTTLNWSNMVFVADSLNSLPLNIAMQTTVVAPEALKLPLGLLHAVFMGYLGTADPQSASRRLPALLGMVESYGATEPLDFVYALLGLLDPEDPVHGWLKPDYSKSVEDVFATVARGLIMTLDQGKSCNEVLSYAGIGYTNKLGAGLPSWAPDLTSQGTRAGTWTYQQHFNRPSHACQFNASGGSALDVFFPSPKVMRMRGIRFDRIAHVGPMLKYIEHYGPEVDEVTSTADMLINHFRSRILVLSKAQRPYPTGQNLQDVFWRSCVGDTQFVRPAPDSLGTACRVWEVMMMRYLSTEAAQGNRIAVEALEKLQDVMQGLHGDEEETGVGVVLQLLELITSNMAVTKDELMRTAMEWNGARMMCCAGRVLCVTEDGWVTFCPPETLVGDVVCVFHGVGTPFLLRQSSDTDSVTMELVGEAYVHGAMDGEGACRSEPEVFTIV